jgi:hypothetical protein
MNMTDCRFAQAERRVAQARVRELVAREVTPVIRAQRGPDGPVQEALVRAVYNPDRRLG